MRIAKVILVYSTLILMFSSVVTSSPPLDEDPLPFWNSEWSYRQEIQLPISTNNSHAKYQPIDIQITFDNPCWTKNENETSIIIEGWPIENQLNFFGISQEAIENMWISLPKPYEEYLGMKYEEKKEGNKLIMKFKT